MTSMRTLIEDALGRFAREGHGGDLGLGDGSALARVEADPTTISTVDCLFDGQATVHLADARSLQLHVFGRFTGRKAEVERAILAA